MIECVFLSRKATGSCWFSRFKIFSREMTRSEMTDAHLTRGRPVALRHGSSCLDCSKNGVFGWFLDELLHTNRRKWPMIQGRKRIFFKEEHQHPQASSGWKNSKVKWSHKKMLGFKFQMIQTTTNCRGNPSPRGCQGDRNASTSRSRCSSATNLLNLLRLALHVCIKHLTFSMDGCVLTLPPRDLMDRLNFLRAKHTCGDWCSASRQPWSDPSPGRHHFRWVCSWPRSEQQDFGSDPQGESQRKTRAKHRNLSPVSISWKGVGFWIWKLFFSSQLVLDGFFCWGICVS